MNTAFRRPVLFTGFTSLLLLCIANVTALPNATTTSEDSTAASNATAFNVTRCQLLQERKWLQLTESAFDTSMLEMPACGRRLKIGQLATFSSSDPVTDFGILNTTVAHALADIECSGILGDLALEIVPASSNCDERIGTEAFLDLLYDSKVAMVLGPECSVVAEQASLLSSFLVLPVVGYSTESPLLSDHNKFDTYFRVNQPGRRNGDGWRLLLQELNVTKVSVIREIGREFDDFVRTFESSIRDSQRIELASSQTVSEKDINATSVINHLLDANARFVVAQVYPNISRQLLCEALRRNLVSCCDNGSKIVFIWPSWFTPLDWLTVPAGERLSCTSEELHNASIGSFLATSEDIIPNGTLHFPDANNSALNLNTTNDWEKRILSAFRQLEADSNYTRSGDIMFAGFLYDSLWTAAYALRNYVQDLAGPDGLRDCDVVDRAIGQLEYQPRSRRNNDGHIGKQERRKLVNNFYDVNFAGVSGTVSFIRNFSDRVDGRGEINLVYAAKPECDFSGVTSLSNLTCNLRQVGVFNTNSSDISLKYSDIVWGPTCTSTQCRNSTSSGFRLEPQKATVSSCAGLQSLADRLGSCRDAIALVVVLPILLGVLIFIAVTYVFRYKYKKKYMERSITRLQQFGLKQNEAYALLVPDKAWEVDRKDLDINRKLGEGAFGTVYGADFFSGRSGKSCKPVAVKTLHDGADGEEKTKFFLEIQLMKNFTHDNVVCMIGVCTTEDPMYIIMELMLHGDLRGFLLGHRHLAEASLAGTPDAINSTRLTAMARDVALGLQYLHSIDFIHRDMAARNCMVTTNFQVKIGDFGMARDVKLTDYYRLKASALLPVRWMAIESLLDGVFTTATDMWSYGVVLYEMITFGALPYPGKENGEVMEFVREGRKMELPSSCPEAVTALMFDCWNPEPECRPKAAAIAQQLTSQKELVEPCLDLWSMRSPNPPPLSRRDTLKRTGTIAQAQDDETNLDDGYVNTLPVVPKLQGNATAGQGESFSPYDTPFSSSPPPDDDVFTEGGNHGAATVMTNRQAHESEPGSSDRNTSNSELMGGIPPSFV